MNRRRIPRDSSTGSQTATEPRRNVMYRIYAPTTEDIDNFHFEATPSDVAAETTTARPTLALASTSASAPATPAAAKPATDDTPSSLALPVQFAFDSARILPDAYRQLDAVAAGIKLVGPTAKI